MPPGGQVLRDRESCVWAHPLGLGQLNSVLRTPQAAPSQAALLGRVRGLHAGARSRWRLVRRDPPLEALLERAGYLPHPPLRVAWAAPQDLVLPPPRATGSPLRVRQGRSDPDLERWMALYHRAWDLPAPRPPWASAGVLEPEGAQRLLLAELDGAVVAGAWLHIDRQRGLGWLWGGATEPAHQGRGCYAALLTARVQLARALGLGALWMEGRPLTTLRAAVRAGFTPTRPVYLWEQLLP